MILVVKQLGGPDLAHHLFDLLRCQEEHMAKFTSEIMAEPLRAQLESE